MYFSPEKRILLALMMTAMAPGCGGLDEATASDLNGFEDGASSSPLGESATCDTSGDPDLQVGPLGTTFAAWQDGDEVVVDSGSEGGLSVAFTLRGRHVDSRALVRTSILVGEDELVQDSEEKAELTLECVGSGDSARGNHRVEIQYSGDPFDLIGLPARVSIGVTFPEQDMELQFEFEGELTF